VPVDVELQGTEKENVTPGPSLTDKGYLTFAFVQALRAWHTAAHVAWFDAHNVHLGDGVLESREYAISQLIRKRIEQFCGWGKSVGGLRKTRLRGVHRYCTRVSDCGKTASANLSSPQRLSM